MKRPGRIVLASANPKKAAELRDLLQGAWRGGVEVLARPEQVAEVVEDQADFLGNARKKSLALHDATGEVALADDSGLEVDGLQGAPGVHSARFAGQGASDAENLARLVAELAEVPEVDARRRARFRCVIVLSGDEGEVVAEGTVEGRITTEPSGENGFGYDPVFVPDEGDGRTFAEMAPAEKHAISHRGRALAALVAALDAP